MAITLAALPASITITNVSGMRFGFANVVFAPGQARTFSLAAMGVGYKSDLWMTAHNARVRGFITTVPATDTLTDPAPSSHLYREPQHTLTGGQLISGGPGWDNQHTLTGGQGDGTAPVVRVAMVRGAGAVLYRDPDRTSPVVARLAAGSRLLVQGTPWRNLMQWAQVEVEGRPGYVAMTEVEVF